MKMNVLITGATGFVGRHLTPEIELKGHNVKTVSSTDFDKIWWLEGKFDIIIHLAVKTAAGGYCQKHPGEQYITNSSINADMMAYWAQYQRQAKMITFGSSCAYDKNEQKTEENYLNGQPEPGYEVYGYNKRSLLIGLRALNKEYGMRYNYMIPSTFYGPNYNLDDKHFIFDLIRKIVDAKNGGPEVTLWGDGHQTRELIFIQDAVNIIINTIEGRINTDVFNLSTGKEYSIRTYAQTICNIVGYDFNKIKWDLDAFVGSKSKNLVNTHLKHFEFTSIEEGLEDTIDYYQEMNRNKKVIGLKINP
tara:strand:+ start:7470 stop:8384 length:915 start_codon:yes stop_codon:yes gene_type:complete